MAGNRKKAGILAALAVFFLGICLEFFCNVPLYLAQKNGEASYPVAMEKLTYSGFEKTEKGLYFIGEEGFIHVPLKGGYIGSFRYSYEYEGLLNLSVRVGMENAYGEVREKSARNLMDRNCKVLDTSWIPIYGKAAYVDVYVNREMLREAGLSYLDFDAMPLVLSDFTAETYPAVNGYRLCFFWCTAGLLAGLLFFRDRFAAKIELGFLIISLSVGSLFSLSLPSNKVSWDEEVHFSQVYWLANYRNPVPVSPAVLQEFSAGIDTWTYNQPGSKQEMAALNDYLDREGDYTNGAHLWSIDLNKTTMTGYGLSALFVKLGSLLRLPFSVIYRMGRLGNLFFYCTIMYLAIKKTPVGKGMLTFLALMPEPILLAGVYSYDPAVTACLALSFAWILSVMLVPEQNMSWKAYAVILISFFWGCRIKAVYAPLLLFGFLIPKEKFKSRRQELLMKGGFGVLCLVLMLSFVLPVVLSPREIGDVRGDSTSEKGQMAYILGQPFAYARVLAANMLRTFPSYLFGEQSLGLIGHQGEFAFPWLLYAGAAAVILTDGWSDGGKLPDKRQRLWIFLLCGAAAVLVWTSMYIAFTRPGNTYIDGVQGRYYLPFLFLVWLVLHPSCVRMELKQREYHALVLGAAGVILLAAYVWHVLWRFCM